MADDGGKLAGDAVQQGVEVVGDAGVEDVHVKVREFLFEGTGVAEVGLGQAHDRGDSTDEGGDEGALDKAGAGRGISHRADDEEEVRVGDDDALVRVRVIGGAAQFGGAVFAADDAGEGVFAATGVTHHTDAVAHFDGGAAQFAGAHADNAGAVFQHDAPSAAVFGDHQSHDSIGVLRPVLGTRPGAFAGADSNVGFVVAGEVPACAFSH